jgi:acetyl-CoA C-acetyltransferase
MSDIYFASGVRTPFSKVDDALAAYDAIELSVPVVQAMAGHLKLGVRPDLAVWGSVVPNSASSLRARGFFDDLIIPVGAADRDTIPRADTSMEKLASLTPAFDRVSGQGSLTAGNSSPVTDGAASVWVATKAGLARLPDNTPFARLVDFEITSVDLQNEGLLMAPSYAILRLLERHKLRYDDIALWEIHEAFAAQVLANVAALEDRDWIKRNTGIARDFGAFPWDRVNPNGSSIAIGHPFAATGARDLSQCVKELFAMGAGSRAIVSVCADGGQGVVALLERP